MKKEYTEDRLANGISMQMGCDEREIKREVSNFHTRASTPLRQYVRFQKPADRRQPKKPKKGGGGG